MDCINYKKRLEEEITVPQLLDKIAGEMCDKYCKFPDQASKESKKERAKDCPLVAIVTCKDCTHRDKYECRHGHPNCKDNFYCMDAERRE